MKVPILITLIITQHKHTTIYYQIVFAQKGQIMLKYSV